MPSPLVTSALSDGRRASDIGVLSEDVEENEEEETVVVKRRPRQVRRYSLQASNSKAVAKSTERRGQHKFHKLFNLDSSEPLLKCELLAREAGNGMGEEKEKKYIANVRQNLQEPSKMTKHASLEKLPQNKLELVKVMINGKLFLQFMIPWAGKSVSFPQYNDSFS